MSIRPDQHYVLSGSQRALFKTISDYPKPYGGYQESISDSEVRKDKQRYDFSLLQNQPHGDFKSPNGHAFVKTVQDSIAGQYYTYRKVTDVYGSTTWIQTYAGETGLFPGGEGFLSQANAYNDVLSKLSEKKRGGVDLSVDVAQAGQTVSMLRSVGKMESYVKGFSRRTIANKWLEFTYGWKPLAQTLYGSVEQLANPRSTRMVFEVASSERVSRKSSVTVDGFVKSRTVDQSCRIKCHMELAPNETALETASRFTSLNPISIAWELVPYSFVVDWVYDIGGYLRNAETALITPSGSILNSYLTKTYMTKCSEQWIGNGIPDVTGTSTFGILNGMTMQKMKVREALLAYPFPDLPQFSVKLGSSRLLSAAALLAQHLGLPSAPKQKRKRVLEVNFQNSVNKSWKDRNRPTKKKE